jgi:hypothetical protein
MRGAASAGASAADVEEIAAFAPRRACSDAERRLAVWAHDDLRARGHDAWVETHWVRPQLAVALALGCALTAIGGLIAIGAPVAGLAVAAVGALSVVVDVAGRSGPLRLLLPRRATQVVLVAPREGEPGGRAAGAGAGRAVGAGATREGEPGGRAAGAGATRAPDTAVELFVVARTDVPRRALARRLERVRGGLWWLALCAPAVVVAAAARVAGADGTLLGAAQLVPTVVLLVAVGSALDAATAPLADGRAQDAALAAALRIHDDLARDPPPGVAPGLLLAGPDALRAHLRRERLRSERTALLHVREGEVASRHPQWRAAAASAGLPARERGPRGLPAALAPPDQAECLARALARTLRSARASL